MLTYLRVATWKKLVLKNGRDDPMRGMTRAIRHLAYSVSALRLRLIVSH
jgi:hypothetical protein